ncbi:heat shock protein HspQ [Methylohalomonas lacus]|uniref:Heat shock protein HspQ n=1 Tax=Methylohalomonas lacus TaxID=398773 RepID=A0AAE3L613_9GAMM|nr:heat shock protein HspQ [Methylohalomonas lacus]
MEITQPEITEARFSIGQLIHHRLFDYRGVIVDIDPVFMGSDEWYEQVAESRPPKDQPWYRVLVDGASHETYVAERHLEDDAEQTPVKHPMVDSFFQSFEQGKYQLQGPVN